MRAFSVITQFVFVASSIFPQTPVVPAFEVASIKPSAMPSGSWIRFTPGGRLSAMSWVKQLIQIAYSVEDYQVSGGPEWITSDRYDIEAKAENADSSKSEMLVMLQSLLADRFKLRIRNEIKGFSVYHLVVEKKGFLGRPLKDGEVSRCGRDNSFACGFTTIAQLAKVLQYFTGRPVLDRTGVDGSFDLLLDFDTFSSRVRLRHRTTTSRPWPRRFRNNSDFDWNPKQRRYPCWWSRTFSDRL